MTYLFDVPKVQAIPVEGENATYPIARIFCVGRNYEAHAREMGTEVDREAPFYFTKSPQAALRSGSTLAYPPGTADLHHEMELAVALGASVFRANRQQASDAVFGYGAALDMTRRDLQAIAKQNRRPWDLGKDFEGSAVFAPLSSAFETRSLRDKRIHLSVNGELRQDACLGDMVHDVPELIMHLSQFYHLGPGDVILTGTPAGVGAVRPGDVISGGIDGLQDIVLHIGD